MRLFSIIWIGLWAFGCDHRGPLDLSNEVDLRYGGGSSSSQVRMQGMELSDHASYDLVEETFRVWSQEAALVPVYDGLREGRPDDTLLAVRASLLRLRLGGVSQVPSVIPVAELLKKEHPDNPDVKFLLAESAFYLLPRGQGEDTFDLEPYGKAGGGPPWITPGVGTPVSVAQTALRLWKDLLALSPDYQGANGMTAERIKARMAALQKAITDKMGTPKAVENGSRRTIPPELLAARLNVLEALQQGTEDKDLCVIGKELKDSEAFPELSRRVRQACQRVEEVLH